MCTSKPAAGKKSDATKHQCFRKHETLQRLVKVFWSVRQAAEGLSLTLLLFSGSHHHRGKWRWKREKRGSSSRQDPSRSTG